MLRFLTIILFFLGTLNLSAQVKYGKITYLQTSEMVWESENEIETPQDKQIKEMMSKMQAGGAFNKNYEATFSPTAFNCVEIKKEAAEMSVDLGDGSSITVMTSDDPPVHYHTNTATGGITNRDNIFDRSFLVTGQPAAVEWTLTGEKVAPSEMTAGLDLLLATGITDTNDTITAGYAPSMPVQVGPLNYYGLPGAIITLEIPKGKSKIVYRATGIELSSEPVDVEQPTEGKAVSLEKFRKEKTKREKAMERTYRN